MNPAVAGVAAPPIADVNSWVADLEFPDERPLLNLAQAVPSYPPAESLVQRVAEVAGEASSAIYAPILGLDALRDAFATHVSDLYGVRVRREEVAITSGCNQAFCVALGALAGAGDQVLLPVPWYFNHQMWLQMQGIDVCPLPFDEQRAGVPDPDVARSLITERTRAIVLVTPNNPTGAEYPAEVLEAFLELAIAHDIVLVMDETYKDFRARPGVPHPLYQDPRWRGHLVCLYSFSKSYAIAGYRVGALVCDGELMAQVEKVQDCISICAARISQEAALHALQHLDSWRDEKVRMMKTRASAVREAFRSNRLEFHLVSTGAYFAWVRHPFDGDGSASVARRLAREHGVLSVPGSTFGPGLDAYLRFAFANLEADVMPELAARLIASQDRV